MQPEEIERLKYRRLYLLSPLEIIPPFLFVKKTIGNKHFLYAHIDLTITDYHQDGISLFLLGDIFDADGISKNNLDILKDIINSDYNFLLKKLSVYCGCFVLIYVRQNEVFLVHDATATKKIYHCFIDGGTWCASQPTLLARVLKLEKSKSESKLQYYKSKAFAALNNASVGNTTCYDEITQVLPNHYLNLNQNKSIRFWPFEEACNLTLQETASLCSKLIQGYIESIAWRYKVMLPVTSGKDSRTLLAATKNIQQSVFYYINKNHDLNYKHKDIQVPSKIFNKLGLNYHIIDPYIPIDKDFKKVYFENNEFASEEHLPFINNYYLNFSDWVNLPGNIATGAVWFYPIYRQKIDNLKLAKINHVESFPHALQTYQEWINNCDELCKAYNFNIWYLYYWEERLGNWGSQYLIDKEIAQIDINPFNSRLLIHSILSIKEPYKIERGNYSFTKSLIYSLWPEVLCEPINPSLKNKLLSIMDNIGLLNNIFKLYFG
jgi:hypothetical protein